MTSAPLQNGSLECVAHLCLRNPYADPSDDGRDEDCNDDCCIKEDDGALG